MSNGDRAEDYVGADADLLAQILVESDKRISAQVQIMLANDTRSIGILAAAATLAGAGFALAGTEMGKDGYGPLLVASIVFGLAASASAVAAVWALWPVGLDVPGWSPRLFVPDIAAWRPHLAIQRSIAALNQRKIADNDACNAKLGGRTRLAMILLCAAPIAGASALLVSILCKAGVPSTHRSGSERAGNAALVIEANSLARVRLPYGGEAGERSAARLDASWSTSAFHLWTPPSAQVWISEE